jgi:hypothetical protein
MAINKVQSGQRLQISASEWNFVRQFCIDFSNPSKPSMRLPVRYQRIKNYCDESIPRFGIVKVTAGLYEQEVNSITRSYTSTIELSGQYPTDDPTEIIAVVQRVCEPQHIEPCIISGATHAWVYVSNLSHQYAVPAKGNIYSLLSSESGNHRLVHPTDKLGLQILPVIINQGATTSESIVHEKELFQAFVISNENNETLIVCPGGKYSDTSYTRIVHTLNTATNEVRTDIVPKLPLPVGNYGGIIYGGDRIILASGENENDKFAVQIYNFAAQEWTSHSTDQSFAGCPVYSTNTGEVVIAGGYNNYYIGAFTPYNLYYNVGITPFWNIDAANGRVTVRYPAHISRAGIPDESSINDLTEERYFTKQNFTGIYYPKEQVVGNRRLLCEFIAVGGSIVDSYMPNAVVTYAYDPDDGNFVGTKNYVGGTGYPYSEQQIYTFNDLPIPVEGTSAVRYNDTLLLAGGRTQENDETYYLDKVLSLSLTDGANWRDDQYESIPTPRINAAAAIATIDGEQHLFLIGGRTAEGLSSKIESLNLEKNTWRTDWANL